MAKNISKMRTMERFYYLRDTSKMCPKCKEEKRLSAFVNKKDDIITKYCTSCNKKIYTQEVQKIVLGVLKGQK